MRGDGWTGNGDVRKITHLNNRDMCWIHLLACGVKPSELHPQSLQYAKNRLRAIRAFLNARTNAAAIAQAFGRGLIR